MSVSKQEVVKKYSQAIREGNAAVFAGAGLSRPSGFVDWKELLRPLAESIELDVDKEGDLPQVAQFYRNSRGTRASVNQTIMDEYTKEVATNENVRILTRLPISTYWTTNYDHLLEDGLAESGRRADVKSESDQLSTTMRDRDAVVYKMHGDVTRPANAVLTKSDYELYDMKRPLFRTALKGDLVSKMFLYIGFSFEDPNLDYILGQIHSLLGENVPDHYCFFKRVNRADYDGDTDYAYEFAKQNLREQNLREYGIQTVFVDSYEEITQVLRLIERDVRVREVFVSGSVKKWPCDWSAQKGQRLAHKLAAALVRNGCRVISGFGNEIGSSVIGGVLEAINEDRYRHLDEHLSLHPFPHVVAPGVQRDQLWQSYRESMMKDAGIAIFTFGNKEDIMTGKIVEADGCLQEFEIAKKLGCAIIPLGSTGGSARRVLDEVKSDISRYPYLVDHLDALDSETDEDKLVSEVLAIVRSLFV